MDSVQLDDVFISEVDPFKMLVPDFTASRFIGAASSNLAEDGGTGQVQTISQ
jgi:hypothetical protein